MLRNDPHNEALMMRLIQTAYETGKSDLALRMIDLLDREGDKRWERPLLSIHYRILERRLRTAEEPETKKKIAETLHRLLARVVKSSTEEEECE